MKFCLSLIFKIKSNVCQEIVLRYFPVNQHLSVFPPCNDFFKLYQTRLMKSVLIFTHFIKSILVLILAHFYKIRLRFLD